jgi:hypothetical protein
MATRRITCLCGALLSQDEREHYAYQCTLCVTWEHELILAHGRGEDHDEIDSLFAGPVDLDLQRPRLSGRHRKAA